MKNDWIYVSERLPDDEQRVLINVKESAFQHVDDIELGEYNAYDREWIVCPSLGYCRRYRLDEVIAWIKKKKKPQEEI